MRIFTIGFTQSSAENFFGRLMKSGVKRVLDVRLNNTSQLAGFAKAGDLPYFLKRIGKIDYRHEPLLAPTEEVMELAKGAKNWSEYEKRFRQLLAQRKIAQKLDRKELDDACLLCSEAKPHHCHRRLIAEYLSEAWGNSIRIEHL